MSEFRIKVRAKTSAPAPAAKSASKPKAYYENAYEGARNRRRLSNWNPSRASINQMLATDGYLLRSRSRDLVRNNPYGASAAESFVSNLVGAGIKPSFLIGDPKLKDQMQQLFRLWTDEADFDELTDLYGLQALVARAMFEAGECFVRFRPQHENIDLAVPFQIQLLESEMLEYNKNHQAENGNWIINGIEIDPEGRRVAYWFWSQYPGDPLYRTEPLEFVRVPANEVLHVFRPLRPKQMRGAPWITPSIVKLWLLDQYDDAELDRKKIAAMYAGFITTPDPEEFYGEDAPDAPLPPPLDPDIPTLEPGTMQALNPGEDVKFSNPAEVGGSYEPFQYRQLLAATSGMGVPYMNSTGDYAKSNYSSSRQGLIEYRGRLEQLVHSCMVFQFCRPISRYFVRTAALAGAIRLPGFAVEPRKYYAIKWIPPRLQWTDPLHDLQAEKLAVDNGYKSRDDVIEESGFDPEEMDRRILQSQKRAKRLGIIIPGEGSPDQVKPQTLAPNPQGPGGDPSESDDEGEEKDSERAE